MKVVAIVLGLFAVGYQPTNTEALPAALRTHVQADRFGIVTSIRGLPLGVRDGLQTLFGGSLDIAEPGAEFQTAGVESSVRPTRRLVAAGCAGDHHCIVYYQRRGSAASWHVAVFQWTPDATSFEWGGTAPSDLATIEDVRKAILSGAVKGPGSVW